jgi:hypothetical protein
MIGLCRLPDRLELELAGGAAELADLDELEWEGHRGPIDRVRHECRTWRSLAADALNAGLEWLRLGESTRAMLVGEIGLAHAALIVLTAEELTLSHCCHRRWHGSARPRADDPPGARSTGRRPRLAGLRETRAVVRGPPPHGRGLGRPDEY